jgi:hypothetical protein
MLFNKSILSFVAAIALASSVAAAATGQQGGNANNQVNQGNQANQDNTKATTNPAQTGSQTTATGPPVCSSGTPMCCDSQQSFSSLSSTFQASLKALDSTVNPDLPVGVNCYAAGTQTWYIRFYPLTSISTERRPVTTTSPKLGLCGNAIQNQGRCLIFSLCECCRKLTCLTIQKMAFPTLPLTALLPNRHGCVTGRRRFWCLPMNVAVGPSYTIY